MLTFAKTLVRFLSLLLAAFITISTLYAVFLKYQHIVMLTFVNAANTFLILLLVSFIYDYSIR